MCRGCGGRGEVWTEPCRGLLRQRRFAGASPDSRVGTCRRLRRHPLPLQGLVAARGPGPCRTPRRDLRLTCRPHWPVTGEGPHAPALRSPESHVDLVGVLFMVWGGLTILIGASTLALGMAAASLISSAARSRPRPVRRQPHRRHLHGARAARHASGEPAHLAVGVLVRRRRHWSQARRHPAWLGGPAAPALRHRARASTRSGSCCARTASGCSKSRSRRRSTRHADGSGAPATAPAIVADAWHAASAIAHTSISKPHGSSTAAHRRPWSAPREALRTLPPSARSIRRVAMTTSA